jgi:hypothetical protein
MYFFKQLKTVDEAGTWRPQYLPCSPFCTWCIEFIFHITIVQKNPLTVQMYVSSSLFITVNENMKQASEWFYKNSSTKRTELSMSIAHAVIAVKDK